MSRPSGLPDAWLGAWASADGRVVTLERDDGRLAVSVSPAVGTPPYREPSADRLPATWLDLGRGDFGVRAEVGASEGLAGAGPTFDLRFMVAGRAATVSDPITQISAIPSVGMGLYDDYDDDLGVPWAFPLVPFQKI